MVADRDRSAPPAGAKSAPPDADTVAREVYDYVLERLRAYYTDNGSGVSGEMFDAVLDRRPRSALDFDLRLQALVEFLKLPDAPALAAANKRIANILRKSDDAAGSAPAALVEPEEIALAQALDALRDPVQSALAAGEYSSALRRLSTLRPVVDAFFDKVLVNAPDPDLRTARLTLLGKLRALFLATADLSRLPG